MRLGINDIRIILALANNNAIERVISIQARMRLSVRLSIRNLLPLINIYDEPVMETFTLSAEPRRFFLRSSFKISVFGTITLLINESIFLEPTSAICIEILILVYEVSMKDLNRPLLSLWPFR